MGMLTMLRRVIVFAVTGLIMGVLFGVIVLAMVSRQFGFFVSMLNAMLPLRKQGFGGFARAKEACSDQQRNNHRFSQQSGGRQFTTDSPLPPLHHQRHQSDQPHQFADLANEGRRIN